MPEPDAKRVKSDTDALEEGELVKLNDTRDNDADEPSTYVPHYANAQQLLDALDGNVEFMAFLADLIPNIVERDQLLFTDDHLPTWTTLNRRMTRTLMLHYTGDLCWNKRLHLTERPPLHFDGADKRHHRDINVWFTLGLKLTSRYSGFNALYSSRLAASVNDDDASEQQQQHKASDASEQQQHTTSDASEQQHKASDVPHIHFSESSREDTLKPIDIVNDPFHVDRSIFYPRGSLRNVKPLTIPEPLIFGEVYMITVSQLCAWMFKESKERSAYFYAIDEEYGKRNRSRKWGKKQ